MSLVIVCALVMGFAATAYADDTAQETEITILYTNDVHTYIDEDITYSNIAAYKEALGENTLLVDAGDHIQGTAYGGMDEGATIIELMNAAGYDLATPGNHEFDYDMDRLMEIISEEADYPYISCNFYSIADDGSESTVLDSYYIFEIDGVKIAFVGITTPESITKSTPAYFQDDDGNYIYGIYGGTDGSALYEAVQEAVDAASQEADIVIALGHLGVDESSSPWTSEEVIANTTGIDAFIDGHSHTTMESEYVTDAEGNEVLLTQTGCYLDTLGQMTITVSSDGSFSISTDLLTFEDLYETIGYEVTSTETATDEDGNEVESEVVTQCLEEDAAVAEIEDAWIASVDEQLGEKIAETDITFTIYDYSSGEQGDRLVREAETNLGDLDADAYYWYINEVASIDCDIAISNGGGVRAEIAAGDWTYLDAKTVNPFGNVLCVVEVSGQDILDALEFGARYTTADASGAECGGFLQVAGLTYKVDTSIENTITEDENGVWLSGPTQYRVYDVQVYNKETGEYEDLDPEATYTLGGTNYTLRDCGDGFDMFSDSYLVLDGIVEDYLALSAYVAAFADTDGNGYANITSANSPLAAYDGYLLNYENAAGAGRITIADGKAAAGTSDETTESEDSDLADTSNDTGTDEDADNGSSEEDAQTSSGDESAASDTDDESADAEEGDSDDTSPETGDENSLIFWFILAAAAAGGTGLTVFRKRVMK